MSTLGRFGTSVLDWRYSHVELYGLRNAKGPQMLTESALIGFVATANPREARSFYETTLGLRFIEESPAAVVFDSNGVMLRIALCAYAIEAWK